MCSIGYVIVDETDDKLLQYSGVLLGVACTLVCVVQPNRSLMKLNVCFTVDC
jgi:hypothetical protein